MTNKITSSLLALGLIFGYLILGYSNYKVRIDDLKDVLFLEQIGNILFQMCHLLVFAGIYFNNRLLGRKLLLIPIIVQLIDILPIDMLHSLKFNLLSQFSIGIGWLFLIFECNRVRNVKYVWIYICALFLLIIGVIPGFSFLVSNIDSNVLIYKIGVKIDSLDSFNVSISNLGTINQSLSLTLYILLVIYSVFDFKKGIES